MSSEDHWKWRQRNPSEFLLKTAKSQAFQIFLWTDVASSLPCSFLNWVKTTWSSRELNFCLLTLKIAFNVLNSASPQKSSPLGRQLPHLNGVHERVLTFTTEVTFSSLMGETARHARSAACWGGRKGRQWGAWDRTPPDQPPAAGSFTARGFDGMEKKKWQAAANVPFCATDGHAKIYPERLRELISIENMNWEVHKFKNDTVTCKLSCIFHLSLYLIRQPRKYRCKANHCCVYLHLKGRWEVTRKVKLFLLEYLLPTKETEVTLNSKKNTTL